MGFSIELILFRKRENSIRLEELQKDGVPLQDIIVSTRSLIQDGALKVKFSISSFSDFFDQNKTTKNSPIYCTGDACYSDRK